MRRNVIAVDSDNPNPSSSVVCTETRELLPNVNHKGAVIADEHHEERRDAFEIFEGNQPAIHVWQRKGRSHGPQLQHLRLGHRHGENLA